MKQSRMAIASLRRDGWRDAVSIGEELHALGHNVSLHEDCRKLNLQIKETIEESPVFLMRGPENPEDIPDEMEKVVMGCESIKPPYERFAAEISFDGGGSVVIASFIVDDMWFTASFDYRNSRKMGFGPLSVGFAMLDEDGALLVDKTMKYPFRIGALDLLRFNGKGEENEDYIRASINHCAYMSALLGCSNVSTDERQATGRMRRGLGGKREPRVVYKTLVVKGRGGRIVADFSGNASGSEISLHSVRGHFKTYTKEAPLLGRYVGRFWCPSYIRGSEEYGQVIKDYEVRCEA